MKRRITLSIALFLSIVLVSLTSSDSRVEAQSQLRFKADTGIVTLGPGQILRISVGAGLGGGPHIIRFRRIGYQPITIEAGVTTLAISSQSAPPVLTLMSGEAAFFDIFPEPLTSAVRGAVLSNNRDTQVNAIVFDTSTWRVVAAYQLSIGPD